MRRALQSRQITFVHEDGCLVRTATSLDGCSYAHRCTQAAFEAVAHALDETPAQGEGTTLERIAHQENLPFTQVNVAMEFLKERGIIDVRHRRSYPATTCIHLDAMVEWYALVKEPLET
jgi:hypothetical protein